MIFLRYFMIMYWVRGEIESLMVGENWIKIVVKGDG